MKQPTPRSPYTPEEQIAAAALKCVTFPVASWDKRFAASLSPAGLTDRERPQLWRLFIRYRRQIHCPRKAELLHLAVAAASSSTANPLTTCHSSQ